MTAKKWAVVGSAGPVEAGTLVAAGAPRGRVRLASRPPKPRRPRRCAASTISTEAAAAKLPPAHQARAHSRSPPVARAADEHRAVDRGSAITTALVRGASKVAHAKQSPYHALGDSGLWPRPQGICFSPCGRRRIELYCSVSLADGPIHQAPRCQ